MPTLAPLGSASAHSPQALPGHTPRCVLDPGCSPHTVPPPPHKEGGSAPPAQQYLSVQVWGISCMDRALYFRQGVTQSELSGKTWKVIVAGREGDRSLSGSSFGLLR